MKNLKIPEGYQTVMPYLIVKGADDFFKFTQSVFGAEEKMRVMRDGGGCIMHAEIFIGNSTIMFADSTEQFKPQTAGMFIYVEDADETYKKALNEGAKSVMEPSNQNYGRACGVTDPVGNTWWITSQIESHE